MSGVKKMQKTAFRTVIPSTSAKQKEDCMTGSPSISKLLHKSVTPLLLQTILFLPDIKWDHFEILATGKSELMKTLVVRSFFFTNFFRKYQLPEVTILLSHFLTSHQCLALVF